MRKDNLLHHQAREAIRNGKMPHRYPERLWGGPGTGARCTICDESVGPDDIEFEMELPSRDDQGGHGNPRVHTRCFSAWETVCRELEQARATAASRRDGQRGSGVGAAPKPS